MDMNYSDYELYKYDRGDSPEEKSRSNATLFHMCIDIGGLLNRSDFELARLFTDKGQKQPGALVRQWLKLEQARGHKVLPLGKPCDGFSYETGCPGHTCPEEE